jgi:hypothetical protein
MRGALAEFLKSSGYNFLEIEVDKGPVRRGRARVNALASCGCGDPDGSEGLQRVHVPDATHTRLRLSTAVACHKLWMDFRLWRA